MTRAQQIHLIVSRVACSEFNDAEFAAYVAAVRRALAAKFMFCKCTTAIAPAYQTKNELRSNSNWDFDYIYQTVAAVRQRMAPVAPAAVPA